MRTKLRLRLRVALVCALLGTVVSACLALIARNAADVYVDRLSQRLLHIEAAALIDRIEQDPSTPLPHTQQFNAYLTQPDGSGAPPSDIAKLPAGNHEDDADESERQIAVYPLGNRRLYVVLDLTSAIHHTRRFIRELISMVLLGSGLAGWLGWVLAGRAIDPVRRLAARVESLQPPHDSTLLASEFANDEVGMLARAFDGYQEKLRDFLRRESEFTADASHELRTPIAVIRGAVEVMQENASLSDNDRQRLMRIQRGANALSDLLDSLLALSRESVSDSAHWEIVDLKMELDGLLVNRREALADRGVTMELNVPTDIALSLPRRTFAVVFNNLLRCAMQFAEGGTLNIQGSKEQIRLQSQSKPNAGTTRKTPHSRPDANGDGDAALGFLMLHRLCERCGWTLNERGHANGVREFILNFFAS